MKHPATLDDFLTDESRMFRADPKGVKTVFLPENYKELSCILRDANVSGELVTVAGSHTGLNGGSVPMDGGVVVGVEGLLNVTLARGFKSFTTHHQLHGLMSYAINEDETEAIFPAGASQLAVEAILNSHGLWHPPNPTEKLALMGSIVANHSSGGRSFGFGTIRDYITRLGVVFPNGGFKLFSRGDITSNEFDRFNFSAGSQDYNFRRPTYEIPNLKTSAGLYTRPGMDFLELLTGSEGILGVFTEVGFRVEKKRPYKSSLLFFEKEDDAFSFVDSMKQFRLDGEEYRNDPDSQDLGILTLEFFDNNSLRLTIKVHVMIMEPWNRDIDVYFMCIFC
ncbi:FAD-binding oxidoreductase [Nanoarchaeota archaeon]